MNNYLVMTEKFSEVLGALFPEVERKNLPILYYLSIGLNYSSITTVSDLSYRQVKHKIERIMKELDVSSLTAARQVYHCRMISYFVNSHCQTVSGPLSSEMSDLL